MNRFALSCSVEKQGMDLLIPALESLWPGCTVVPLHGRDPRMVKLQMEFGDLMIFRKETDRRKPQIAEVKVERETVTGSFFAETWSNNLLNPGWVAKSNACYLIYVFLEPSPIAYIMDMGDFQKWVRANDSTLKEARPRANSEQKNETVGKLVPIHRILADFDREGCKYRIVDMKALAFLEREAARR